MTDIVSLRTEAEKMIQTCTNKGLKIATAESCTGGLLAGLLTEIPGSSAVVERGFVTYSNEAKNEMIGVPMDLINTHGAVSEEVARAMAEGALAHSHADVTVAITGVAGPGGGTAAKPVGLVHFATARRDGPTVPSVKRFQDNGRDGIRHQALTWALQILFNSIR